ncbi:MAG: hypothetical protein ACFFBD_23140 [Candidatus Hodarchaeota archaeon]
MAQTYFLKAKIALLTQDVECARDLLGQAHQIAEEKGYNRLAHVIINEQKRLAGTLPDWLQDEKISLIDRIEQSRLVNLFTALKQRRIGFTETPVTDPPSIEELKSFVKELGTRHTQW